ncbi:MAG: nucleotidyl transferase AbiEii/AbiGii toxin family protein, partial [Dehalococcoidia bacterium]|nr:nucleotidyl transferase AbiEii/AbiGii toxin family protein [Dehalococcoidia bacterium]
MSRRPVSDLPASIRQRLLNRAHETNRPFNELLQYFAMERFLYRLSESPHAAMFVLKGALMFTTLTTLRSRPTMDIDLLGRFSNSIDGVVDVMRDVCLQNVEPDGMDFDPNSIVGERIAEAADYEGVRVRLHGALGTAQISIRLDVGFGDVVFPSACATDYPSLLDSPSPRLNCYSKESAIAEKFHIMVRLGTLNSRMKDYFDIWFLSRQFEFDGQTLATAIKRTFENRRTEIPPRPTALSVGFSEDSAKQTQWRAFIRKNRLEDTTGDLRQVVFAIAAFLGPLADALAEGRSPPGT